MRVEDYNNLLVEYQDYQQYAELVPRSMPLVYAWIESERPATMSDEQYAANPRADVNQDGKVDAADLLAIRAPENWQKKIRPEGVPELSVLRYDGTDKDACVVDVRTPNAILRRHLILSTAHGVTLSKIWKPYGCTIEGCDIQTEGYGIYTEGDRLTVRDTIIAARRRDPIRIAGGFGLVFGEGSCAMPLADVATRIHDDAQNILFRNWDFYCWSWGVDLGEQYRGAGGVVRDVRFENCRFYASEHTIHAIRIRAQNVHLRNCHGIGFNRALPGATFASVERHSCDPTGVVLEGCTVDGGKPLLKSRWADTEVK